MSVLVALGAVPAQAAQAEDFALSFELPQMAAPTPEPVVADSAASTQAAPAEVVADAPQPLPIPARAANPPMRYHSPQQLPGGVYRQAVAVALNEGSTPASILPPTPPQNAPVVAVAAPEATLPSTPPPETFIPEAIALSFDIAPPPTTLVAEAPSVPVSEAELLSGLFQGDSDSLVARAVGSAEGTRTPTGGITSAYYGHTDPGNQVWNMGTFSYQHGATSATEADQKQLRRLQSQSQVLQQRAKQQGLTLTLEETLNGIDLANQSPLAAIGRVGYIERLAEAKQMGYEGSEAIVVARTRSYINPNTDRWNAPGLGNTEASITRDQRRRANAVASALAAYRQEQPHLQAATWAIGAVAEPTPSPEPIATAPEPAEPADIIFQPWTDGSESTPTVTAEELPVPATRPPRGNTLATVVDRVLGLTVPSPGADSPVLDPVIDPDPVVDPVPTVAEELLGASQTGTEQSGTEQSGTEQSGTEPSEQPGTMPAPMAADYPASTIWAEVREANQTPPLVDPASGPGEFREIPAPSQVSPPREPEVVPPATDPDVAAPAVSELPDGESGAIATPTAELSPQPVQPSEHSLGTLPPEQNQNGDNYSAVGLDQMPGATPDTVLHFPSAHTVREAYFSLDELSPFTDD